MCHDKTLVTWPHLTASNVEKYSFYMSGQGKKLDFWECNWPCSSSSLFSICLFILYLMHRLSMPLLFLVSLFGCVFWHPNTVCPNTLCRNTTFSCGEYVRSLQLKVICWTLIDFFFLLYFLIIETYILLVIWVHAWSYLQTICSKIIVPVLY